MKNGGEMKEKWETALLNEVDEGIILLNQSGLVEIFNQRACFITGVGREATRPHPAGNILPGDVVIIADTMVGHDDGGLRPEDLSCLGIDVTGLVQGDAALAVGRYRSPEVKGVFKHIRRNSVNDLDALKTTFEGVSISAEIDPLRQWVAIETQGERFAMNYVFSLGHLVVLDGETLDVKFYQDAGYTVRKESIAALLKGEPFYAKGTPFPVIGKHISEILEENRLLKDIERCLEERTGYFEKAYYELNKRPVLCTFKPIEENGRYLLKVYDLSNVEMLIRERNQWIKVMTRAHAERYPEELKQEMRSIIGNSPAIQRVRYLIYRASQTRSTVLLTGESGTGKTLIAREIHNLTFSEEDQPFISVNCSAIPIHLFESELFGYIKGAFTGAERTGKKGLFELAENGTLFLDEIGELPPEMQVKLLHALQSKAFYKVGATTPTQVNVRIIAATNKNLLSEIKQKNFREDLYYRINGFPIEIPPLRRRKSDLYPLIDNFLEQLPTHIGGRPKALTGDALEQILRYDWPGNIRELENILELAYNMAEGDYIGEDDLLIPEGSTDMMTLKGYLENQEKAYIEQQLEASKFSVQETLKALGLSKTAFYEKVKKYGILLRPDEF